MSTIKKKGPSRKHDVMAQYIAVRNGMLQQEQESRIEIRRFFEQFKKDIQLFEERRNAKRAGQAKKTAVVAEIVRHRVRAHRDILEEEEEDKRLEVSSLERRMHASLRRLFEYEHHCVSLVEKEGRLKKHESAKRLILENDEIKDINEILTVFGRTAWKPKLRVLGTCPFHKREQCPFATGTCHGMTVGTLHQAHLQQQQMQTSYFHQLTGQSESKGDVLISADFASDMGLPLSPPRGTQGRTVLDAAQQALQEYGETLAYQAHCMEYDIDTIPVEMLQ